MGSKDGGTRSSDRLAKHRRSRLRERHDKAEQCERVHHSVKTKRRGEGSRAMLGTIRRWSCLIGLARLAFLPASNAVVAAWITE